MYFNKSNSFYHGIMFHHFHDHQIHVKSQGSIDRDEFYKLIKFIGKENILDASAFYEKLKNKSLRDKDVCFTFDDAIKCQIDVALPVLEDLNIKSFFFVYTSIFDGKPDNLEVFRFFRMNFFNNVDEFYKYFYSFLNRDYKKFLNQHDNEIKYRKSKYPFYSIEDIKFRLIRNNFLTKDEYQKIMFSMFSEKKFNPENIYEKLFFKKEDLRTLDNLGHIVGLHSHSHPTSLEKLNYSNQKDEYQKCISLISEILERPKNTIKCMSHPCGSFNLDTLQVLKELGIELGFKNLIQKQFLKNKNDDINSLQISRANHSDIMSLINK